MSSNTKRAIISFSFFTFFIFIFVALYSYSPLDNGVLSISMQNIMSPASGGNLSGKVGASISSMIVDAFGVASWFLVGFGLLISFYSLSRKVSKTHIFSAIFLVLSISMSISSFVVDGGFVERYNYGGSLGAFVSSYLTPQIGELGVVVVILISIVHYFFYVNKEIIKSRSSK